MELHGWCERCKKVKRVRVTSAGMAAFAAGGIVTGTCASCEEGGKK